MFVLDRRADCCPENYYFSLDSINSALSAVQKYLLRVFFDSLQHAAIVDCSREEKKKIRGEREREREKWERKNQPKLVNFRFDVLKRRNTKSEKRERERHTHTHTHTERSFLGLFLPIL